jgi:hypothetical protein
MKTFKSLLTVLFVAGLITAISIFVDKTAKGSVESYHAKPMVLTVTPRFMTITNTTSKLKMFYSASLINSGTGIATIANRYGETTTISSSEIMSIGKYSTDTYVDSLTIAAPATTVKVIYYK